jgi:hypothetical protein
VPDTVFNMTLLWSKIEINKYKIEDEKKGQKATTAIFVDLLSANHRIDFFIISTSFRLWFVQIVEAV